MKNFIPFIFTFLLAFSTQLLSAQLTKKPKTVQITKVAKFKPPVVNSFLGRNKDTVSVTLDEAIQLVSLPIKVTDAQNNVYTVASYGFVYKGRSVVESEENGKKEVKYTTIGDQFRTTPLPEVWKSNIKRTLKKDEQLFFFDILVKDKQNRPFYAPNILIKVS